MNDTEDRRFYVRYDPAGKLTGGGIMQYAIILMMQGTGDPMLITPQDLASNLDLCRESAKTWYVDLTSGGPVLLQRPVIDWDFTKTVLAPGEEVTLPNLPPGTVRFTGPLSGSQEDFSIGFTLPGQYALTVEAWPYQTRTFMLTVETQP